jgi:pectin methylesterase-like acyl-CoA thioesterase
MMSYNFYGGENFTRIQGAIENASAGDTVLVYNGTYFENVVIYKRFTCIDLNKIKF